MGRLYTAVLSGTSVSVASDLLFIQPSSIAGFTIHEVKVSQDASTTSTQLPVAIIRTAQSFSALGTSITPQNLLDGNTVVFGGIVRGATGSASTVLATLWRDSQNIINGWHYLPTPETRITVSAVTSSRIAIQFPTAPAAALTVSAIIVLEEA